MTPDTDVKDSVLSALHSIGAELQTGYVAGKQFAAEQVPEVAREIVTWGIASNVIWAVFSAIGAAFSCWACIRFHHWIVKDHAEEIYPSMIIPAGCALALAVFSMNCAASALEVAVAPRLYLLKQAVKIAKGDL